MNVRDETRHDVHKKRCSSLRAFMYRDASHLWRSFSHNRTKINIQFLNDISQLFRKEFDMAAKVINITQRN